MKRELLIIVAVVLGLTLMVSKSSAHHSFAAQYDVNKPHHDRRHCHES